MASNTFGTIFSLTTFGESHGTSMGGVLDGCPAGLTIDEAFIQAELDKRKPGQSGVTSQRKESDKVQILAGIFEGKSTGAPIAFIIANEDAKSKDYEHLKEVYRPSHADYTYEQKYGLRDHRGGGRSSARETVSRVAGGAIAKLLLQELGVKVQAYVSQVGEIKLLKDYKDLKLESTYESIVRCPDETIASMMEQRINQVRKEGDTIGGVITGVVQGVPTGWGTPVFDKLHADLGKAMLSINAAKGFDYGAGFEGLSMKGSEQNDIFYKEGDKVETKSNYSGGVQGGISNGQDIYFRVAFKPVSTLMQTQKTVNSKGEEVELEGKGRHDPCVLPRAVAIVEAMAALVLADHYLRSKNNRI